MDVLLAIKPEFAEKILDGEKGYEFRRTSFQDSSEVGLIFLYASSPISKVVGLFTSDRVVEGSPAELWELFGDQSGMDNKDRFMSYFDGANTGFAIEVDRTHRFENPTDPDSIIQEFSPPMSFNYLDSNEADKLRAKVPESFQTRTVATDLTQFEK